MDFEWDPTKNLKNLKKHRIRFEEALTVFSFPRFTRVDPRDYVEIVVIGSITSQVDLSLDHG
jgi:uncharacterized protein